MVDSLGMLEKAVAKDSTKFDNLYKLGVMYLDRDRVSEAARVFTKANQLKPKDARVMTNLGAAYDAAGDGTNAQKWYSQALAIAPKDSVALCRLAASIHGQQKYDEAMKMLRDMLANNKGVRWTLVFLHKPMWFEGSVAKTGWLEVEKLLKDRPYTVFAGHVHRYQKFVRQGR